MRAGVKPSQVTDGSAPQLKSAKYNGITGTAAPDLRPFGRNRLRVGHVFA